MFSTEILLFIIIFLLLKYIISFCKLILILTTKLCALKPLNLKEKYGDWAVVTGSTDGIGKEYAKELAKCNINIVLISRSLEKLANTKNEIHKLNPNVEIKIIRADFSKGITELQYIQSQLQDIPVGILVNNVGIFFDYPMYFDELSEHTILNLLSINVESLTLMTHMVIKGMLKRNKGAIVNLSSASNIFPIPLISIYSASKIYVQYISEAIRKEYSKTNLTIQCLSPFYVNTNMVKFKIPLENWLFYPDAEVYSRNAIRTLGRFDSTTGYWMHDILEFFIKLVPTWIASFFVMFLNINSRKIRTNVPYRNQNKIQ